MRLYRRREAVRELAQREAVGALLCLLLLVLLLMLQRLIELSAEAVLGGNLQRHAGPVMADRGEVCCENVALWEAADDVWKSCVGAYWPTVC